MNRTTTENLKNSVASAALAAMIYVIILAAIANLTHDGEIILSSLIVNVALIGGATFLIAFVSGLIISTLKQKRGN